MRANWSLFVSISSLLTSLSMPIAWFSRLWLTWLTAVMPLMQRRFAIFWTVRVTCRISAVSATWWKWSILCQPLPMLNTMLKSLQKRPFYGGWFRVWQSLSIKPTMVTGCQRKLSPELKKPWLMSVRRPIAVALKISVMCWILTLAIWRLGLCRHQISLELRLATVSWTRWRLVCMRKN